MHLNARGPTPRRERAANDGTFTRGGRRKKKGEEKLGVSVALCHPAYRAGVRVFPQYFASIKVP